MNINEQLYNVIPDTFVGFSQKYQKGSVTFFALSVKKSGFETLTFPAPLSSQTVHVYLLTPVGQEGLTSKLVDLKFMETNGMG